MAEEAIEVFRSFDYQQNQIRVARVDDDGTVWFVAKDVCDVLSIVNVTRATDGLDDDEKGLHIVKTLRGPQEMAVISESGFYSLVTRSRKEAAKPFRRWVNHEVLPSIRKTGRYEASGRPNPQKSLPSNQIVTDLERRVLVRKAQASGPATLAWGEACRRFHFIKSGPLFATVPLYQFAAVGQFLDEINAKGKCLPSPVKQTTPPRTLTVKNVQKVEFKGRGFTVEQLAKKLTGRFALQDGSLDASVVESLLSQEGIRCDPWTKLNGLSEDVWDEEGFEVLAAAYQKTLVKTASHPYTFASHQAR